MSSYVKDVSLELSEFKNSHDENILEEGGVPQRSSTASVKSKWSDVLEAVLNPNEQHHSDRRIFAPRWDVIFNVASAFAVFIDPLICYIPVIVESRNCFYWDQRFMWYFLALRWTGDVLYALDILVFLRRSRGKGKAKSFASAWIQFLGGPHTKISKRLLYHEKSLVFLGILPRICAALPVLQAILLLGKYARYKMDISKLLYLIPIQYSIRAYNLNRWVDERAQIDTAIKRFRKALLDFLPFALAAHLFGALWYFFAAFAEVACWANHICDPAKEVCDEEWAHNYDFTCSPYIERRFIDDRVDIKFLKKSCSVEVTKTSPYDFGIYKYALQSDLTRTKNLPLKILQCFWWGLRNLSSFGQDLRTNFEKDQIILSIVISISGLALFLVYLNARVQGLQKISKEIKLRQKKEAAYREIINQTRNIYHLRLALLKKLSMLEGIDKKVLESICRHLKPVTYGDDFYIIREGELVRKMIFVTRGSALMYTNSHGGTYVCTCLERNDFYGDELLNWAFKLASFSELPVSTTTVLCQEKVEAFAITANHLKSAVEEYWWHFKKHLSPSQLEQLAASSLQAAWRRYYVRAGPNWPARTNEQI